MARRRAFDSACERMCILISSRIWRSALFSGVPGLRSAFFFATCSRSPSDGGAAIAQVHHLLGRDLALATIERADVADRAEVAVSGVAPVVEATGRLRIPVDPDAAAILSSTTLAIPHLPPPVE